MCPDGPYLMSDEGITRLIRSYAYARAVSENSVLKTEKHIFGPNLTLLETNWDKVRNSRDQILKQTGDDFFFRMSTGMKGRAGIDYLEGLIEDRDEYTSSVQEKQRTATKATMASIASSVNFGENAIKVATFVRDAAAETELVLASVALAPAAVVGGGLVSGAGVVAATEGVTAGSTAGAGVVLGSVGKGAIKWQDTGSISQGLVEAYAELVINSFTVGIKNEIRAARKVEKVVVGLVFGMIKGEIKTVTSAAYMSPEDMAAGKKMSVAQLLLPGLSNIPSAIAKDVVETLSKDPKWAVPAAVVLKLALKYGSNAAVNAKPPGAPAAGGYAFQKSPGSEWRLARVSLKVTDSSCLFDCARPCERYVTDSALRPLESRLTANRY